jgi:hypothetical protein
MVLRNDQEQQHDDHRQHGAEQRGVAHGVDRVADERRLVLRWSERCRRGMNPLTRSWRACASFTSPRRATVFALGCLRTRQAHGRHAVEPRPQPLLAVACRDGRRIRTAGCARPPGTSATSTLRTSSTLRNLPAVLPTISRSPDATRPAATSWFVERMASMTSDTVRPYDAALLIERDLDLAMQAARDVDGRDALDREQLRPQPVLHPVAQRDQVARRRREPTS